MIKRMTSNAGKPKGFWGSMMINKMNKCHFELTKWAIGNIDFQKQDVVADIGCGGGNCIKLIHDLGIQKIYGIDYSSLSVKKATKKNKKAIKTGQIQIFEANVESLPFADSSIDTVIAVESVYFWPDIDKALQEIKRTLKPHGSLNIVCEMVKNDDGTGKHTDVAELLKLNYYSKKELEGIFKRCRFSDIKVLFDNERTWLLITGRK